MSKALLPVKAEILDGDEEAAWFAGQVPRRLLAIPFGGPIPSPIHPDGVDLDGETFTAGTDIYGSHRFLRRNRERLTDFHHRKDGRMGTAVIGKAVLDDEPADDGWWVDFWFKAGERRVDLIRRLKDRGAMLFGSSEPYAPEVKKAKDGAILVWPYILQTISTSPQNTYSVIRPKALLDDAAFAGIPVSDAFRALLADAIALDGSLRDPSLAVDAAKAGREVSHTNLAELEAMLDDWQHGYLSGQLRLKGLISRIRAKYTKEDTITNG